MRPGNDKGKNIAIVLAAGKGKRMGTDIPKQFLSIHDKPVLYYSLKVFQEHEDIDEIVLVLSEEYKEYTQREILEKYGITKVSAIAEGGAERYDSVMAGLSACVDCSCVFIHDGARPCITKEIIDRCLAAVDETGACAAGMPSKDTIKIADENGCVSYTPPRQRVWNIQTPQVFSYKLICDAYKEIREKSMTGITDDAMVVESSNKAKIHLVEGSYENIKVTTPDDIKVLENLLK